MFDSHCAPCLYWAFFLALGCNRGNLGNGVSEQGESAASQSGSPKQVTIGVVAPFEGSNAHIGEMIMNSVKLGLRDLGPSAWAVDLEPIDSRSNPSAATAAVQAAVSKTELAAIIGFYHSSTALACKPIIQEGRVPTLIYSASNPTVTDEAPYYYRLVPTDDDQAIVLADYAKGLGCESLGLLYYADDYGKGLSEGVRDRAEELGMTVKAVESYDFHTVDFRPLLSVVKQGNPDALVICGFVEKTVAILNQAAEISLDATILAGDGSFNESELIRGAGQNAEGVFVAAPFVFDSRNQKNQEFLKKYWATYQSSEINPRKPASWSAFAYDAMGILSESLSQGHGDRESIKRHLDAMKENDTAYQGIVGPTYFDSEGNAVARRFALAVVEGQKFEAAASPER